MTNPLKRADLDEFVALYNPANQHQRQATWCAELDSGSEAGMTPAGRRRVYEYDELIARENGVSVKANLGTAEVKARAPAGTTRRASTSSGSRTKASPTATTSRRRRVG